MVVGIVTSFEVVDMEVADIPITAMHRIKIGIMDSVFDVYYTWARE
jgi:hypothetical protein